MSEQMSVFQRLNAIDVNAHTEKKNDLTYLSWAWAWAEVKKAYPNATYTIYERETEFGPVNYFTDGRTCWVKTGLNINGLEHIECLPVMNYSNKSIPLNSVTSTDVNKAIQRSLTKAAARHGLGLYIYAGEDLPEDAAEAKKRELEEAKKKGNLEMVKVEPAKIDQPVQKTKATVVAADSVPQLEETAESYRKKAWMKYKVDFDDETGEKLAGYQKQLVEMGLIEDIAVRQMTLDKMKAFFGLVYSTFGDTRRAG